MTGSSEPNASSPQLLTRRPQSLILIGMFVVMVVLFLIGVFVNQVLEQVRVMERQTSDLSRALDDSLRRMEEVERKSVESLSRAVKAEQNAFHAAQGRTEAEEAREKAEQDRNEARQEAHTAKEEVEVAQKDARTARKETKIIRRERDQELNRLQNALSRIVKTRRTALGVVMNLDSDAVEFDFDQATLRPKNRELLSRIAGVLLSSKGYRVQVYGHTDDIGTDEYNKKLSERRGQAVQDYLEDAGIDPNIMTTKGYGKSNPLVIGTTPEARAKNRRVEIAVIDTVVNYQQTLPSVAREDETR